jgi:hypothetical protein
MWCCENGGKPEMASLGVWCTLRKQRIWFDSRRDVARLAFATTDCNPIDLLIPEQWVFGQDL